MSEKTGDTLWQPDGSGGVQPQRVGGGSRLSQLPQDLVREAPEDGGLYLRGNAGWELYTPPAPGVDEAPQDGVQYTRQDGQWAPVTVSPVDGDLSVSGDVIGQGFIILADPSSGLRVGNRNYNDDRYAGSTETWYRLSNPFAADNAVQVYLSSGVKDDFGPRLFTRSNDRLYPNRTGRWMYAVAAFFEDVTDATNRSNRMLAIRKNGATVVRNNYSDNEAGAMTVHCTVVLNDTDYLAVEVRFGFDTSADVYLQVTNMGPV